MNCCVKNRAGSWLGLMVLASLAARGHAGVTVTQNVSPGATSWPVTAVISSVSNPAGEATVGETFTSGGGNTNHSQTFTVNSDFALSRVNIYAGGGSGGTMRLRLFDLGTDLTPPAPSPYTAGTDLFGSGAGLSFSYNNQFPGVLQFDFTGADRVALQSGRLYAFEITGTINTSPLYWYRGTNNTYSGGAAYRNRAWINGSNARDFSLAIYGTDDPSPASGQCTVKWNDVRQRIDGFGGGTVFLNPPSLSPVTDANMDSLFGTNNANQLGLTLLRIRISPNGNWANDLADASKATARGARIIASPWSPPASMKDNGNTIGGSLLPAQYANYASYLNNFANYMKTNSAALTMISVQNEPDITVTYESCDWTPAQLQTFFHNNASAITSAPVMMPESYQFNFAFSDPTLNDPVAAANVAAVGGHLYGFNQVIKDYPNARNKGKRTWMTEYLVNDQTWGAALDTAQQVHECLTTANMSAYIWWKCLGDTNGLVNASGVPQKRGFVMAQFSRFVRPGFARIGVTNNTGPLQISAYKNSTNGNFAIVAINPTITNVSQTFNLSGFNTTNVVPWITSATDSLALQPAITVIGAAFTNTIPAMSVVTFAGQAAETNAPPEMSPVADQFANAGVTLVITNVASDPNLPPQTLTFSLLDGPTNATLVASNGIFTWRPLVSQADTTNQFIVKVADDGTPSLSATNNFAVTVNPLAQPGFGGISVSGEQATLLVNGDAGPDYTLLISTNLTDWQPLLTTNPAAMPFQFTLPVSAEPQRYFRLELGP